MSRKIVTPTFRVSFPHVFEAVPFAEGQKKKYSVVMLFDKTEDLSDLISIVKDAITEKWGDKKPKDLKSPFRDGDEKDYPGYEGMIFCSATSIQKPAVVDETLQHILDPEEFYAGCYARASITAFAYDTMGNRGVAFGLQNVQKIKDGEAFSGKAKPEDEFEAVESTEAPQNTADNKELFDL